MTSKNSPCEPVATADRAEPAGEIVLETRFGTFSFDPAQSIHMPQGLLGFADLKEFGLVQLPQPGFQQLMLLQSLADAATTFITMPLSIVSALIEKKHLEEVCETLEIAGGDLAVLLVVSIRKEKELDRPQISVNLRAPVFLDTRNRTGRQYVLPSGKYPVRHVLNTDDAGEIASADSSPGKTTP